MSDSPQLVPLATTTAATTAATAPLTLYRVLATGIPLDMSPEAFYDCLRAYTTVSYGADAASAVPLVHNALLLRVPADTSTPEERDSGKARSTAGGTTVESNAARWRHTGAAIVDFISKRTADAVVSLGGLPSSPNISSSERYVGTGHYPFRCESVVTPTTASQSTAQHSPQTTKQSARRRTQSVAAERAGVISWQPLGPVEAAVGSTAAALRRTHEAARAAGVAAYVATRWRPTAEAADGTVSPEEEGSERGKRPRCELPASPQQQDATEAEADSVKVWLESDDLPRVVGPLWRETHTSPEVSLFSSFSHLLHAKLLLTGTVHSLHRVSDTHVVLSTDAFTADFLHTRYRHRSACLTTSILPSPELVCSGTGASSSQDNGEACASTTHPCELRWRVMDSAEECACLPLSVLCDVMETAEDCGEGTTVDERGGPHDALCTSASIADILAGVARVLAGTGNEAGAFVDSHGNVVFPSLAALREC